MSKHFFKVVNLISVLGGWNNNPSVTGFQSIFRKLVTWCEAPLYSSLICIIKMRYLRFNFDNIGMVCFKELSYLMLINVSETLSCP
ncbi:hypothetical protein EB796_018922 [Bugula neritina]|uniref:Uncharacterized protein n=1 Tax=Bugula neritina TaxID=10212 RepID=A0A7J7JAT1_BUGNE|nr:hypothetical protein EB796_018922 [Bugula neritina]